MYLYACSTNIILIPKNLSVRKLLLVKKSKLWTTTKFMERVKYFIARYVLLHKARICVHKEFQNPFGRRLKNEGSKNITANAYGKHYWKL